MLRNAARGAVRHASTTPTKASASAPVLEAVAPTRKPYPFSSIAIIPPAPTLPPTPQLAKGKGIMAHLRTTLPTPEKQVLLKTLFSRRHPKRLLPGSIITVILEHAPNVFTGVLLGIRRRGPDTSFLLRNVVQRTGVEFQFFVNSPHVKEIKIEQRAGGGSGPNESRRQRRAKLFFLRDSPEKMTNIARGVDK
ncbi:hypothetical protein PLICRDRAFT_129765 [Plicaturopsis crispa FD-325 SS-3]|nr:hypothetical protein PLICRDRAFT_129765 [Plicaturopsis crispa FD-325 SS-3]